jgi:hypothetical protein
LELTFSFATNVATRRFDSARRLRGHDQQRRQRLYQIRKMRFSIFGGGDHVEKKASK